MQCVFAGVCFGTKVVRWWRMGPHRNRDTVPPFWLHTFDTRPTWWTGTRGKHSIFSNSFHGLNSTCWVFFRHLGDRRSPFHQGLPSPGDPGVRGSIRSIRRATEGPHVHLQRLGIGQAAKLVMIHDGMQAHLGDALALRIVRSSLGPHRVAGALRILGHMIRTDPDSSQSMSKKIFKDDAVIFCDQNYPRKHQSPEGWEVGWPALSLWSMIPSRKIVAFVTYWPTIQHIP